ncbi:uncharacterized protein [Amphiura filiformis]|uniref:uncharacterized protein n=1 Tax=Amphiura filiformis TaxID=82378 RepID=UPI003B21B912
MASLTPRSNQVVKEYLTKDKTLGDRTNLSVDQIIELLTICLKTTYFSYNNKFFIQQYGCAMGSAVSPIVVNIYMENFEQIVLDKYPGNPPKLWLRYVDDTFVVIDRNEAAAVYKFINEVDPNIKFTQEECVDNKLAFLDCQVHIHEDGSLKSTVYREPTHTDFYLQFDSHHPLIHKLGVIRSLQHRANTIISDQEDLPGEQNHIQKSLGCCGYPNWAFTKAKKTKEHTQNQNAETGTGTQVTIPYISGLSERIKNTLKSFGIATSYKPTNIIRGKLVHVKDKPPKDKQSNLVYGITCAATDCGEAYVGETKQSLRARINQHRRPSSSEAQNSAVFNHCKTTEHFFKPEEVVILDKEEKVVRAGCQGSHLGESGAASHQQKGDSAFNCRTLKDTLTCELAFKKVLMNTHFIIGYDNKFTANTSLTICCLFVVALYEVLAEALAVVLASVEEDSSDRCSVLHP